MQLHLTDQQLIERVRWHQRHRRVFGIVCLLVGVAGVLILSYLANDLYEQSQSTLDLVAQSSSPTTEQIATSVDETRFLMGFVVGSLFAGGISGLSGLAAAGCVLLLTRSRKDTLLLKCWDEARPRVDPLVE